ncbi:GIY-YIG nuclease family protein [Vibrio sp. T3Y01]|uniref:GIY-YIG nuclease family protein n=1 Tax=Vibrio sp. T3Y01 TaxID=2607606 RepID=UPI0014934A6F|nr:GIY-YIG nuclease family protein [Vibrio sp. T3Y01]
MDRNSLEEALKTPFRNNKYRCDHIYIAYSPALHIFKIGISSNPKARLSQLKTTGIGEVKDWEYHFVRKVGTITAHSQEVEVSRQLYNHNIQLNYLNCTGADYSRELYRCDIKIIKAAFKSVGLTIPVTSPALRKRFIATVPKMNFLQWVNLNRENVGLSAITLEELQNSRFYTIPEDANFSA